MKTTKGLILACVKCAGVCSNCFYGEFCSSWQSTGNGVVYVDDKGNPYPSEEVEV